jgi:hypothetical protein
MIADFKHEAFIIYENLPRNKVKKTKPNNQIVKKKLSKLQINMLANPRKIANPTKSQKHKTVTIKTRDCR